VEVADTLPALEQCDGRYAKSEEWRYGLTVPLMRWTSKSTGHLP